VSELVAFEEFLMEEQQSSCADMVSSADIELEMQCNAMADQISIWLPRTSMKEDLTRYDNHIIGVPRLCSRLYEYINNVEGDRPMTKVFARYENLLGFAQKRLEQGMLDRLRHIRKHLYAFAEEHSLDTTLLDREMYDEAASELPACNGRTVLIKGLEALHTIYFRTPNMPKLAFDRHMRQYHTFGKEREEFLRTLEEHSNRTEPFFYAPQDL